MTGQKVTKATNCTKVTKIAKATKGTKATKVTSRRSPQGDTEDHKYKRPTGNKQTPRRKSR